MKKLLFAGGLIIAGLGVAYAQNKANITKAPVAVEQQERVAHTERKMDPKMIADKKTARLDKTVQLTEDQRTQIHAIYLEQATKMQGRAMMHQETNNRVKAVLTADQVEQMQDAHAIRKAQKIERMENRKAFQKDAPGKKAIAK